MQVEHRRIGPAKLVIARPKDGQGETIVLIDEDTPRDQALTAAEVLMDRWERRQLANKLRGGTTRLAVLLAAALLSLASLTAWVSPLSLARLVDRMPHARPAPAYAGEASWQGPTAVGAPPPVELAAEEAGSAGTRPRRRATPDTTATTAPPSSAPTPGSAVRRGNRPAPVLHPATQQPAKSALVLQNAVPPATTRPPVTTGPPPPDEETVTEGKGVEEPGDQACEARAEHQPDHAKGKDDPKHCRPVP